MSNETTKQPYIPALGFDWLTRFYDPVLRATLREDRFKRLLIAQACLQPGQDVLDLGCGTATLTIMLKQSCPGAKIIGLDGDPKILAIARQKIAAAGVDVELHEGMAFAPPFAPASFDRVVSSLVFHHLTTENKRRTLAKVRELLRPGGELHVADWGKPHNTLMWIASLGHPVAGWCRDDGRQPQRAPGRADGASRLLHGRRDPPGDDDLRNALALPRRGGALTG